MSKRDEMIERAKGFVFDNDLTRDSMFDTMADFALRILAEHTPDRLQLVEQLRRGRVTQTTSEQQLAQANDRGADERLKIAINALESISGTISADYAIRRANKALIDMGVYPSTGETETE